MWFFYLRKTLILALISFESTLGFGQQLVRIEYLVSYSRENISESYGIPATNDVDLYKVTYTSMNLEEMVDTLSGLIGIPDTEDQINPLLIYGHGTVNSRDDVPSRLSIEHLVVAVFGSLGYFSLAPDYLGLGDSEGVHPYVHAETEVSASYDMIKAIRTSTEENDFLVNEQNFIFGYSQGGHTAMALQRFMEIDNPDGYEVTASAPSSGPYSISKEMINFTLSEEEYFFPAYLANVAISYQAVYGDILSEQGISSFFKSEYADEIEKFEKEEIGLSELNSRLIELLIINHGMSIAKFMIKDSMLNEILNNPESTINMALADNDVYDWAPNAPTRLFYCKSDDQVIYTNSLVAEETMIANGAADVASLDVGTSLSHTECVPNAITLTYFFFSEYKMSNYTYEYIVNNKYILYPNPADKFVIIHNEKGEYMEGKATIMDMTGKVILTTISATDNPINIDNLSAGQYFLIWSTREKNEVHKMIIID